MLFNNDAMSKNKAPSSHFGVRPTSTPKIGKAERTRTAIINAALEFLWTHRFRDLTVASLMASTSAGRSAFYRYFGDLHELMAALLEMLRDEIVAATVPWHAGIGDPVALLDAPSCVPLLMQPPRIVV